MFKNDSHSIQQLLVAEKKAEEKVNQARKRKNLRLKQAKEEAHDEILCLKNEKEKEFKDHEAKFLGSKEATELKIERDTEKNLSELAKFVRLNQELVLNYLLDQSFNINCEVHKNFRATIA